MATNRQQVHYRKPANRKSAGRRTAIENSNQVGDQPSVESSRQVGGWYDDEARRQEGGSSYSEYPRRASSPSYDECPRQESSPSYDEYPRQESGPSYSGASRQANRRTDAEALKRANWRPAAETPRRASQRPVSVPGQGSGRQAAAIPKWVFVAIAAVVVLLLAFGIASAIMTRSSSPEVKPDDEQQLAAGPTALNDVEQQSESGAEQQKSDDSLAWRDADFAVDPARTDWNYEGNGEKVVYLTIDDGPSDKTQQVLDILDRYGCKATFFVVGHDDAYFPMIAEAYKRGHTIGLHTYTHDYAQLYASPEAYFNDLEAIGKVVEEQIGYVPCFIRFPGGSSNEISANYCPGIMSQLVDDVQQRGYQYYDWNVSSGDGSDHTTEELIGYSTEPTELNNIVFLCHDSTMKQTTVDALPAIIEHYQGLGYTFKALDRDAVVVHHGVNN